MKIMTHIHYERMDIHLTGRKMQEILQKYFQKIHKKLLTNNRLCAIIQTVKRANNNKQLY